MSNQNSNNNHLVVTDLCCSRGRRELFSGLNFSVSSGEVLVIRGENGSGKTSLLRLLASLALPDDGSIEWNGQSIWRDLAGYRREIRYLGHHSAVKTELTVKENIRQFCSLDTNHVPVDVKQIATQVGLHRRLNVHGGRLSAGQKRRLSLTRFLIAPRSLWILDEPLTALDTGFIQQIEQWIREHLEAGGMAILSTHRELMLDNVRVRHLCL